MIVLLDTSTPICRLAFYEQSFIARDEWEAGRDLAENLLGYLKEQLELRGKSWDDITGIGVYKGPGSFTGLRIGLAVLNTLADARQIPIVGATNDDWQQQAIGRLEAGEDEQIVMPLYGREANITKPRK